MNATGSVESTKFPEIRRCIYKLLQTFFNPNGCNWFGGKKKPPACAGFSASLARFEGFRSGHDLLTCETRFSLLTALGTMDKVSSDCLVTRISMDEVPRAS
jgi:hypothetical protein